MSTEQINIRLKPDLVAALDRVAREESLDRATAIRRMLHDSIRRWELDRAVRGYRTGDLSLGRAAEEAGISQWELLEAVEEAGLAHPLTAEDAERRLSELTGEGQRTLPDIPPKPGGVLLVGINPAPVSVAAGHYYQGRIGQRLWRRLERLGLLEDAVPGAEDEAFARAGHGLTDLVKRPTASSSLLSDAELRAGIDALLGKIREWQPGLVLFAFKEPAKRLLGPVKPGRGPELEGIPTFLLSGPYAPREEAARIDVEVERALGKSTVPAPSDVERVQQATGKDLDTAAAKRDSSSSTRRVQVKTTHSPNGHTTLHEEIARILRENGNRWMTTAELAAAVNAAGNYRKKDGTPVSDFQIHGRTKNYPQLFERDGSRVRLRD